MFAEELGGNTQRRRQEEARARRRQLKQQQQKKAQPVVAASASTLTTTTTTTESFSITPQDAGTDVTPTTQQSFPGGGGVTDATGTVPAIMTTTVTTKMTTDTILGLNGGASSTGTGTTSNNRSSAVTNALQQRQLRQQTQHQQKAAICIQSVYRAHRSNCKLLKQQSTLIAQRLKDISTLRVVLKQQGKGEYIPPPALVTSLVQQVSFLTKKVPYHRSRRSSGGGIGANEALPDYTFPVPTVKVRDILNDPLKLHLLLQVVILPGLNSEDENMNPFVVWMQTPQGKYRVRALLRLCLVVATFPNIDPQVLSSITKFLRGVLVVGNSGSNNNHTIHASIVATCRPFLISPSIPQSTSKNGTSISVSSVAARKIFCQQHARSDVQMDLLQIIRYHLLYATGGPDPIPPEADRCREACIPPKHRAQADALLQLVMDVIQNTSNQRERQNLSLRFVSEILTIPLLTWKTSPTTTSKLLAVDNHNRLQQYQPSQQQPTRQQTIVLISMIQMFVDSHGPTLSAGGIESVLAGDTPLTACPATPTQSLLANLILLGRSTPILNGSDIQKLDYVSTTLFFQFVATLCDAVPLGTFSSRESVVEWISDGKGHHSPVVLSSVVMEQCKMLLVDAFVRKLLHCAIDDNLLGTEEILTHKNEKDLKQETALQEAGRASASNLAAQEARMDRNRSFWNSSGWGKKVSKFLAGGDSGDSKTQASGRTGGTLINTSSVSKKLAESGSNKRGANKPHEMEVGPRVKREAYSPELLLALCRVYGIILARWGGGGREDIVRRVKGGPLMKKDDNGANQEIAAAKADLCTQTLLNVLCFSTSILRTLWGLIQSDAAVVADLYAVIDPAKGSVPVRSLDIRPCYSTSGGSSTNRGSNRMKNDGAALLYLFVSALIHVLIITDDSEIHDMEKPIPLHQLRRCIQMLKQLLYRSCCHDDASRSETSGMGSNSKGPKSNYFGLALISASSRTMRDLYDRSSRRPFCVPKLWLVEGLMEKDIKGCNKHADYVALLSSPVLRVCPFLVSFKRRLRIFERIVTTNRVDIQGENSQNPFHTNPLKPGLPVRITRGRILEDGLATMNNLGRNMRQRIAVQYHNEAGMREDGVDAGGLFKEFWTDLCAIAFDPNYALFRVTEGGGNCMYPSPSSGAAHGADHIALFEFLGRILGKALFEGITIRPQFAHFFLSFLRGDYNYFHMLPDLSTMDPQLHNNLMFLKTYDGDAEDLCLTFTVANDDFGGNIEVPLVPNGGDLPVTNANKQRYIGLVAKHHVVDRVKEQSEAFTRGLWEVIDRQWLLLFNEPELQVLISGATDGKIDVDDMRQNTRYVGGYTGIDRNISRFWKVVATLSSKHQADLLRFVTSCERPPPLGFSSLIPPFTIQRVGILRDGDKLPTASTCFNVLKLPTYSSEKVLRDRLIYAIEAGAGFELT